MLFVSFLPSIFRSEGEGETDQAMPGNHFAALTAEGGEIGVVGADNGFVLLDGGVEDGVVFFVCKVQLVE